MTRFAPAPTGWLHLGHVLNACYVWNTAAQLGCRVLLRIEDHDRERCRREFEQGILDDLDWLGFVPDVYGTDCYRAGPCPGRQSDREDVYRAAAQDLIDRHLIYACDCSRKDLLAANPPGPGIEQAYPGTCRDRGLPLTGACGWRLRLEHAIEEFDDALLGRQRQAPWQQCGDLLIRDRLGNWTYQFAVAVDDSRQDIDLVVRGVDLLASTGRQIQLARMLGRLTPPTYMHHPLIMKAPDRKLSKADRDTGLHQLRRAGWTRERVFAELEERLR